MTEEGCVYTSEIATEVYTRELTLVVVRVLILTSYHQYCSDHGFLQNLSYIGIAC